MISLMDSGLGVLLDLKPADQPSTVNAKLVCFFASQGEPADAIAKKLSLREEQVERICASKEGTELIIRLQTALYPDPAIRVKKLSHMALDAKTRLLVQTQNEALRNTVATDLLDRAMGKATQITENRNINFDVKDAEALDKQILASRDRLDKIEKMKRALPA